MEVALITTKINRHTGEIIERETKKIKKVDEDEFYRPLVEVLGDAFLEQYNKNKKEVI